MALPRRLILELSGPAPAEPEPVSESERLRLLGGSGGRVVESMGLPGRAAALAEPAAAAEALARGISDEEKEEDDDDDDDDDEEEEEGAPGAGGAGGEKPFCCWLKKANSSAALKTASSVSGIGVALIAMRWLWSKMAAAAFPVLQQCKQVQVEPQMTPAW